MTEETQNLNAATSNIVPTQERGELAFKLEQEAIQLKNRIGTDFLEMGRILKEIRDNGYYVELGYSKITEWLSERSISPSWAWTFIDIYETLVLEAETSASGSG